MTGVNPPGNFLWYADTTDEQLGRYAKLCTQDASARGRVIRAGADADHRKSEQRATDVENSEMAPSQG